MYLLVFKEIFFFFLEICKNLKLKEYEKLLFYFIDLIFIYNDIIYFL